MLLHNENKKRRKGEKKKEEEQQQQTNKKQELLMIMIHSKCLPIKHPIWNTLGASLVKFSKMRPILQIGRIGSGTETHPSIYQNVEKAP